MEQIIQKFFEYGLLGMIVIVEGFVIKYMDAENKKQSAARLQDMKEVKDSVIKPIEAIQNTLNTILYIIQGQERK
jgi:hypothetical protein